MNMMKRLGLISAICLTGCAVNSGAAEESSETGEATFAILSVPSDVGCLVLRAESARGSVEQRVSATAGSEVHAVVDRIPTGSVTFAGKAYDAACPASGTPLPSGAIASWVADPLTATVTAGARTPVTLTFRKQGQAEVTADFVTDDVPTCTPTPAEVNSGATVRGVLGFGTFTPAFNLTGNPAMTVPYGYTSRGLPLSVQFAGRYGAEDVLFRLAGQLEQAAPWADRRPAIVAG